MQNNGKMTKNHSFLDIKLSLFSFSPFSLSLTTWTRLFLFTRKRGNKKSFLIKIKLIRNKMSRKKLSKTVLEMKFMKRTKIEQEKVN